MMVSKPSAVPRGGWLPALPPAGGATPLASLPSREAMGLSQSPSLCSHQMALGH